MKRIASILAIAFGVAFTLSSAPAKAVDFDDHDVYVLESANTTLVVDGLKQGSATIKVKKGDVIDVQFTQMYHGDHVWWFAGITPAWPGFFLLQHFDGPQINGLPHSKEPGVMAFKIDAKEIGGYKLVFKYGPTSQDPFKQRFETPDQTIELTLDVQ